MTNPTNNTIPVGTTYLPIQQTWTGTSTQFANYVVDAVDRGRPLTLVVENDGALLVHEYDNPAALRLTVEGLVENAEGGDDA